MSYTQIIKWALMQNITCEKKFNWRDCTTWNYCHEGGKWNLPSCSPGSEHPHRVPPDLVSSYHFLHTFATGFVQRRPKGPCHRAAMTSQACALSLHWQGKTEQRQDWPVGFLTGFTLCYRLDASFPTCQSLGKCLWTSFCPHMPEQDLLWAGCIIVMAGKALFPSI